MARRQHAVELSVGDIDQRLRSEKSHQQLGRRGFDSRHLQECSGLVREYCWRCANTLSVVAIKNRTRPLDCVAHTNPRRLRSRPEFEVLRSIVIAHPIAMVNRFTRLQVPSEQLFGDEDVLEYVWARSRSRVARYSQHYVTGLVKRPPSLPVTVRRLRNCSARRARLGLRLSRPTT